MEKNNGKIAVAIVAMFVVALSIVGVTYAYFTTTVKYNETETVEVESGVLRVVYDAGETIDTAASGVVVVPGWANDGDKFYDKFLSNHDGNIYATSLSELKRQEGLSEEQIAEYETQYRDRVVAPLSFTVTNQSTANKTAWYGIRLKAITNTVADVDGNNSLTTDATVGEGESAVTVDEVEESKNVVLYLYKDAALTIPVDGYKDAQGKAVGMEIGLGTDAQDRNVSYPISMINTQEDKYYAVVEYKNASSAQNFAQGKNIAVTFEIVGLNDIDGTFKTASGDVWQASKKLQAQTAN